MPRINWNELNNVMGKGGKRSTGQFKKGNKTFWLRKGESRDIRVLSAVPVPISKHWVPTIRRYELCSENDLCVYCHEYYRTKDSDSPKCGYPRPASSFWVYDYSTYHIENLGTEKTKNLQFHTCSGSPATCIHCKNGLERRESGLRRMDLWTKNTQMLQAADEAIGVRCASCGTGKLTVVSYECKACGTPFHHVDSEYALITCASCGTKGAPNAVYECSSCDAPIPASILDCDVTVSKFEDGGTSFQPLSITPLREDISKIALPDLKKEFIPDDPAVMASNLKINNPFGANEYTQYHKQDVYSNNTHSSMPSNDEVFN